MGDASNTSQDVEHLRLLSIFHYMVGGLTAMFDRAGGEGAAEAVVRWSRAEHGGWSRHTERDLHEFDWRLAR